MMRWAFKGCLVFLKGGDTAREGCNSVRNCCHTTRRASANNKTNVLYAMQETYMMTQLYSRGLRNDELSQ